MSCQSDGFWSSEEEKQRTEGKERRCRQPGGERESDVNLKIPQTASSKFLSWGGGGGKGEKPNEGGGGWGGGVGGAKRKKHSIGRLFEQRPEQSNLFGHGWWSCLLTLILSDITLPPFPYVAKDLKFQSFCILVTASLC